MKKTLAAAAIAVLAVVGTAHSADAAKLPKKFANCTAMNKVYPHGVGKPGAVDSTSGDPVTGFVVNRALYNRNKGSDRDKDGIACEKL